MQPKSKGRWPATDPTPSCANNDTTQNNIPIRQSLYIENQYFIIQFYCFDLFQLRFCISPIAPHSLSVRPVVVRDDVKIRLEVCSRSHNFLLACDGQSESLPHSTVISFECAPHTIKVIKIKHKHFFETLRDKLMWGADQRN